MTRKFHVELLWRSDHWQLHEVEADSPEEAVDRAVDGESAVIRDGDLIPHEPDILSVEEVKEKKEAGQEAEKKAEKAGVRT